MRKELMCKRLIDLGESVVSRIMKIYNNYLVELKIAYNKRRFL